MLLRNLKISVDYPNTSYIPPKIGQVCCRKIEEYENFITAEIINENHNSGLYKTRLIVKAYDEKGYYLGTNTSLYDAKASDKILYLFPRTRYIFATNLDFPGTKYVPPFDTVLFSTKIVHELKFKFVSLRWKNLSEISFPQVTVSDDRLVEIKGKQYLQFNLTNLSSSIHSFQVNVGFYNDHGILIGGVMDYAQVGIVKNIPKQMKIKIPFELPSDCNYIIQPYANTPGLLFFLKRKKKT